MHESLLAILGLGFSLGLIHALDADHIMAISSLSNRDNKYLNSRNRVDTLRFCAQWALGHGGVLCMLGGLVFFLGAHIPESLSFIAEKLIGLILLFLGIWILWQLYQQKIGISAHSHNGISHVHLTTQTNKKKHDHSPVLVGITHGLAGSAPVLALIPTANHGQPWQGFLYLLCFSAGVLCTMLIFGLAYGSIQKFLHRISQRLFDASRFMMALFAITFGTYWLIAV